MNRNTGPQSDPKRVANPSVSGKILLGILGGVLAVVVGFAQSMKK